MNTDVDLDLASLHDVAHTKRFLERLLGDPAFRREAGGTPSARGRLLQSAGIELSAADLAPFWPLLGVRRQAEPGAEEAARPLQDHRLATLWAGWCQARYDRCQTVASRWVPRGDPRLGAWRRRHLARARSESLFEIDPFRSPLLSFELSKGCSTQCWFCALSPLELQAYFPYTAENRRLWRDVLRVTWDLFGPACRSAICYHATEPTDNPDYLDFLRDVREVYASHPSTTTSRPLKNLAWTNELLRLRSASPDGDDRFSILTLRTLRQVHDAFTAERLLNVGLVLQNRGSLTAKARVGRALQQRGRLEAEEHLVRHECLPRSVSLRTITCTCGYVVNLVDRSIQLISPCNASSRWPLGYVVHAAGTFRDAADLRDFVLRSVDECMPEHLAEGDRVAFRDDFTYESRADGFVLTSAYRRHVAAGNQHVVLLGELVRRGEFTTGRITDRLVREGMPALQVVSWLERLYQGGLLADRDWPA